METNTWTGFGLCMCRGWSSKPISDGGQSRGSALTSRPCQRPAIGITATPQSCTDKQSGVLLFNMRLVVPRAAWSAVGKRFVQSTWLASRTQSLNRHQAITSGLGTSVRALSSTAYRHHQDKGDDPDRQWSTPLAKQLGDAISVGPLSRPSLGGLSLTTSS